MSQAPKQILMIGIGNDGRSDDALGWKFVQRFQGNEIFDVEYRYQLQIEDAQLISTYQKVIFVDASQRKWNEGFSFHLCEKQISSYYTTHKLSPETVLWMANDLYNARPESYIMELTGKRWALKQGLSSSAQANLERALQHFEYWVQQHILINNRASQVGSHLIGLGENNCL